MRVVGDYILLDGPKGVTIFLPKMIDDGKRTTVIFQGGHAITSDEAVNLSEEGTDQMRAGMAMFPDKPPNDDLLPLVERLLLQEGSKHED